MQHLPRFAVSLTTLLLISLIPFSGCTREPRDAPLPGTQLRLRVEAHLDNKRTTLRESIGHYALVYDVSQDHLHRFLAQIYPRREGPDIVMAALGGIELHGGGVLNLILTLWRPNDRSAGLSDTYPFARSKSPTTLNEIYESLRMQMFLPVPGIDPHEIEGRLPEQPMLPRTRVLHATSGRPEETELDAYNALHLLVRYETDLRSEWTNRLGQRISAAKLLDHSWDHYITPRSAAEEFADHSYLHLVEILLAYSHRSDAPLRRDPNHLKRRFLSVELERKDYGGYEASEALGHYAESLGFLLAEPGIAWTPAEIMKVREWLHDLETNHFVDLDKAPLQHLAHLRRGLARIEENAARLR